MTLLSIKGLILNGPARALSSNEPSPNGHGELKRVSAQLLASAKWY